MKSVKTITAIFSVIIAITVVGCDSGAKTEKEKPKGVIPEAQLKSMEKAKGVEDVLADAEEKRRKEIERQSEQ